MRRWIVLAAVLAALVSLVRHFPLAWAAAGLPDEVGTFSGTVWDGQAVGVPLLGSVAVKGGLGGVTLQTAPGDVTLRGTVSPRSVDDLVLSMPVSRLPTTDGRLSGLAGRFSLRIDAADISGQSCQSATGTASTNVLAANGARFSWTGPELSGPVDCTDGRLRVILSGEDANGSVEALTTTGLDGTYATDVTVRAPDPAAGNALVLFGFTPAGAGEYRLSEQGRWR